MEMGFSAYGVTQNMDDPVSKAMHGLLDHAVETDRRFEVLLARLKAAGIDLDGDVAACDRFDPNQLSKMVD